MIDRRRFLKLFAGGVVVAAHAGVPAALVRPIARTTIAWVDADGDFACSLVGILVNARRAAFPSQPMDWDKVDRIAKARLAVLDRGGKS